MAAQARLPGGPSHGPGGGARSLVFRRGATRIPGPGRLGVAPLSESRSRSAAAPGLVRVRVPASATTACDRDKLHSVTDDFLGLFDGFGSSIFALFVPGRSENFLL